jgi:tetratricopeptide (TPR) repeat protein
MQGKWEAARGYYVRALTLTQATPDPAREASALRGIATAARQMGDPQESLKWLELGLSLNRKTGDRLGEMRTLVGILGALYELGAWDRLIAVADKAIPEAEAMGNRPSLARMRQNRALAARALGDRATARQLLVEAERDCEVMGDFRLGGLVRNCLGLVAEDDGSYQEALQLYRTALAGAEAIQAATEIAYAQHDLGALFLRLGQPLDAIPLLEAAREAWSGQENILLRIKSEAFLGLALLAAGARARADELAAKGWAAFQAGVPVGEQPQDWLWALCRLQTATGQREPAYTVLRAAYAELQRQARAISNPGLRRSFFERVPLNVDIVEAYHQLADTPGVVSVSLARREAPLGRFLREDEYVSARWTISAPDDEAIADKAERRQYRLKRLLQQAVDQGAAPTDEDLARALGVSRRTILRDMQALAQDMPRPPTRRRRA